MGACASILTDIIIFCHFAGKNILGGNNMKKFLAIVPFVVLLIACQSNPALKTTNFVSSVEAEKEGTGIEIRVLDVEWQTPLFEPAGIRDILIEIKNSGSSIARVNWAKSSLNYNNSSYGIFLEGMKFMDAGKEPPVTVLPKGGSISRRVYSASRVEFYGGSWVIYPMAPNIQLLLCVEIDGKENYFTISAFRK